MEDYISVVNKFAGGVLTIKPPDLIWQAHPTLLLAEIFFYFVGFLTLTHALRLGGRYPYLWFSILIHGLLLECGTAKIEQLTSFWHGQASIMLLGGKVPLYIAFVYHGIMYTAIVTAAKLRLGNCSEAFAAGLLAMILDYPLEILGVKLLWWTWHDTDPQMSERHLGAPWLCLLFQAVSTCSFMITFHALRSLFVKHRQRYESCGFIAETFFSVLTVCLAAVLWVINLCVFFHVLHDKLRLHTEICTLVVLSIYAMITWLADRNPPSSARSNKGNWLDEIGFVVFLQFSFYILLVSFAQPENIQSAGHHEPIGPCGDLFTVQTPLGQEMTRRKYLCLDHPQHQHNQSVYNFACLPTHPKSGSTWYTVCGTEFSNYEDYLLTIMLSCCLGFFVFWQILGYSGNYPKTKHQPALHTHQQYQNVKKHN